MESLASTKAGQPWLRRKCSMVPILGLMTLQRGHTPSLLDMSQCLVRDSTLARPDKNLAWTTAFDTSYGAVPQVTNMGWVVVRDIKAGLKYLREDLFRKEASARSFLSQKSRTAVFTIFLKDCLEGGLSRKVIGWGRRYFRESFLISRNHDFEDGLAETKEFLA